MAASGLLRFTQFARQFVKVVSEEIGKRAPDEAPSLLSSEIRVHDVAYGFALAVLLLIARILLERTMMEKALRFRAHVRRRLSENLFYTVYYTLAFAMYALVLEPSVSWRVPLLRNENSLVRPLMNPFPPPMNLIERAYYSQAFGFYLSALIFLVAFDPRRSDFNELLLHHGVTLGLVVGSYLYGYVRTGILIIALHDIGDVFLYGAKFVHYLGYKGLDTALFVVFTITFYVTRLLVYSRIVYAISVETLISVSETPTLCGWARYFDTYIWHYLFFSVFLITLLVLHCFWFALVLRMCHRELFLGKKVSDEGDIRSDDEDEDEVAEDDKVRHQSSVAKGMSKNGMKSSS